MSTPLYLTPKMGLIPEVSTQNYGTLAKALREYVSNAVDAKAKHVWITFSRNADSASILDIRDDGVGMALSDMQEQFLAVGGSRKFNDPQTIGRIGIGFLAIVPFCERITIYTKARDETMAIRADIDTNTMLPQGVRFDEIATKQIGSATTLSADDTRRLVAQYGESFTVFTLTNLRADVANTFSEPDDFTAFKEELRTILPLPWPKTGPLQNMISEQLWSLLTKRASQHHTTVYLNDPKSPLTRRIYGENTTAENALYVQEFIEQIILAPDASVGQSVPIRIIGFFVCDEPTNEPRKGRKLTGVITRVLNVAVDEDTFFGLEGKEERKKRVAGELFIEGLDANQAIQINRNAFTETHKPVQLFREEMRHQLTTFLSGMNRIWRARSVINKEVRRIRDLVSGVGDALTAINASPEGLKPQGKSRRPPALMKHPLRRHFSIRPSRGVPPSLRLKMADDVSPAGKTPYRIELQSGPQTDLQGTVYVSRKLLDTRAVVFDIGGSPFGLRVVAGSRTDQPCAIDLHSRIVVLNEEHPLVRTGDKSIIEVLIFITYATELATSPSELARHVIDLLTAARVSA